MNEGIIRGGCRCCVACRRARMISPPSATALECFSLVEKLEVNYYWVDSFLRRCVIKGRTQIDWRHNWITMTKWDVTWHQFVNTWCSTYNCTKSGVFTSLLRHAVGKLTRNMYIQRSLKRRCCACEFIAMREKSKCSWKMYGEKCGHSVWEALELRGFEV